MKNRIKKILVFNRRIIRGMRFQLMLAGTAFIIFYCYENGRTLFMYVGIAMLVMLLIDEYYRLSGSTLNFLKGIRKRVSGTQSTENADK